MSRSLTAALPFVVTLALAACGGRAYAPPTFQKTVQPTETEARLQAISAVDADVVWASGVGGTVLRTTDAGQHWNSLTVPDASELQFRDVHAFDATNAVLLSAGDGAQSRIYRTSDGGQTWTLQYTVTEPKGFLDCLDFWDSDRGLAYGDSVDGSLYILRTSNGGATWARAAEKAMPKAGPGEGGFAASGGCVRVAAGGKAWIATGAGGNARVLRTSDWGTTWTASDTPHARGDAAGIMTLVRSSSALLALGGDLEMPDATSETRVAASLDDGATWALRSSPNFTGAIYGAAIGGSTKHPILVALGPKGAAISHDEGSHWRPLDTGDFWSVDFGTALRFWAVGPKGRIVRFDGTTK